MKEQQKPSWLKSSLVRVLVWPESPFTIISSIWNIILPTKTKVTAEEIAAFRKLTLSQRWEKIKKSDWTNKKLAQERNWSCWLSYLFLLCSLTILVGTGLAIELMNWFQVLGALSYSGAAFFFFARLSMWIYAIDNKQVIFFEDWLRIPAVWFPVLNSKGDF